MNLERIKTKQVADTIKDRIDDLRVTGVLPEPVLRKMIAFKKLLRTINETDIDLCGYLEQQAQVIIYLPDGYSEIYLRNSDIQKPESIDQIDALDLPEDQQITLFNFDFWTRVRRIVDTYLIASNEYPLSKRVEGTRYKLMPYDEFTNVEDTFRDQIYEKDVYPAFYDSQRSRILLDSPVNGDKFVHFVGILIPEKIDFEEISEGSWSDYTVTAPEIAEEALVTGCLHRLMPMGTDIKQLFEREYEREKVKAAARMPVDTSSFTLDSNIGPW